MDGSDRLLEIFPELAKLPSQKSQVTRFIRDAYITGGSTLRDAAESVGRSLAAVKNASSKEAWTSYRDRLAVMVTTGAVEMIAAEPETVEASFSVVAEPEPEAKTEPHSQPIEPPTPKLSETAIAVPKVDVKRILIEQVQIARTQRIAAGNLTTIVKMAITMQTPERMAEIISKMSPLAIARIASIAAQTAATASRTEREALGIHEPSLQIHLSGNPDLSHLSEEELRAIAYPEGEAI
jgi:hypothetical protein